MIKAMIIDDEKLIREGLVTYIDWKSLGVEVCGVCGDCTGGIRMALEVRPQLILADICLPDASGLEMFRQIRDCSLGCQVIFISSYSEFQYAQQAVKLGAFDYLLKPIEADVLYDCVRRCAEKIRSMKPEETETIDPKAAGKVLFDALTGGLQTDQIFFAMTEKMGAPQKSRPFLGVSVLGEFLFPDFFERENIPILASCKTYISDHVMCCCFFTTPEQEEKLPKRLDEMFRESTFQTVCLCTGDMSLETCLQKALCEVILRQKPSEGRGILFLPEKQALAPEVMKGQNTDDLKAAVFQFLEFCRENLWTVNYVDFRFECFQFLENVYKQVTWVYGSPLPTGLDMHRFIEQLRKPNNLYDLFFVLSGILETMFSEMQKDSCQSPYTRKVLAMIRSRYGESLSLKSVAKELHVSSSYLSSVFKADTGYPFSEYLFRHRMNIAYDLVRQGNLKIYEIGEKVGYPDVAQFSKCFKKEFGYSPRQLQGQV